MKVELLVNLKGEEIWKKGLVLDSEKAPIPAEIFMEIEHNTGTVRVIEEDKPEQDTIVVDEPDVPKPPKPAGSIEEEAGRRGAAAGRALRDRLKGELPEEKVVSEKATKADTTEYMCEICGKIFTPEEYSDPIKRKRALQGHKMGAHKTGKK